MTTSTDSDTSLKTIALCSTHFDPVALAPRMRNRFAPVHVSQEVDVIRLLVTPNDPGVTIRINGAVETGGRESAPIKLNPGRNIQVVEVTGADGKTTGVYSVRVNRDFPVPHWAKVSDANAWSPRDSAGELVFDGRLWLFGGYTPSTARDVWCSRDGVTWTQTGEISASPRGIDIPLAFVFRDRMWVSDLDGTLFSSANGFDWTLETDQAPWRGRHAAGAATFAGRMWVMGGTAKGAFLNDIWSSGDGTHWTLEVESSPWSKRIFHNTPLVLDGRMWIIGGAAMGDYYPFRTYNDVWSSPDGRNWDRVTDDAPWLGRIWGSTVVYRDRLWLLGGFRSEPTWENLGDVWYTSDGAHWHQLAFPATCRHSGGANVPVVVNNSIWAPRHEMSVYAHNGKMWMVGGMVWPLMNDVWCLDIPGLIFVTQPVIEDFVGTRYVYRARADFNHSRGPVHYRLIDSPDWLTVIPETGLVEGAAPGAGEWVVTIEAYDAAGETTRQRYTLHILPIE